MPRYLIWMTDGTQFVVPGGRRYLLSWCRRTRWSCYNGSFSTLGWNAVSLKNRDAFPVINEIVLPQSHAAVVAGTRQNRAHAIPADAPDRAVVIIKLRNYIRFEMRHTGLRTLAERRSIRLFSNLSIILYAILSTCTHSVGFKVTIRTSFVAIANVWKFLPKLGANAMS